MADFDASIEIFRDAAVEAAESPHLYGRDEGDTVKTPPQRQPQTFLHLGIKRRPLTPLNRANIQAPKFKAISRPMKMKPGSASEAHRRGGQENQFESKIISQGCLPMDYLTGQFNSTVEQGNLSFNPQVSSTPVTIPQDKKTGEKAATRKPNKRKTERKVDEPTVKKPKEYPLCQIIQFDKK